MVEFEQRRSLDLRVSRHDIPWLGIIIFVALLCWWLDSVRVDHWRANCRKESVIAGLSDEDLERACYLPDE